MNHSSTNFEYPLNDAFPSVDTLKLSGDWTVGRWRIDLIRNLFSSISTNFPKLETLNIECRLVRYDYEYQIFPDIFDMTPSTFLAILPSHIKGKILFYIEGSDIEVR